MTAATMTPSVLPFGVGLTDPAPEEFQTTVVDGQEFVEIPGGLTVTGSVRPDDSVDPDVGPGDRTPEWHNLEPFAIATKAVDRSLYLMVMGYPDNGRSPGNHPMTRISWPCVQKYLDRVGDRFNLPTEDQIETAMRGPALDMRRVMEEESGRFSAADFVDFARDRFENFVFGRNLSERIYTDPTDRSFRQRTREQPFYGWRVRSTISGLLTHDDVWYGQGTTTSVGWGPKGPFGTYNLNGNTWEWVLDPYIPTPGRQFVVENASRILRGAGFNKIFGLRAGIRAATFPEDFNDEIGFRVVLSPGARKAAGV